ncbi:MAG: tripartite tricarboxylate transporter TctB family protein [Clostridia bacterium]
MKQIKTNLYSGITLFMFGLLLLILIPMYVDVGGVSIIGPRVFPTFITFALIFFSIILIGTSVLQLKKKQKAVYTQEEKEVLNFKDELRVFKIFLAILLYIFLFNKVGYGISTTIFITLCLIILQVKKAWYYLVAYTVSYIVYLAFTKLLFISL